MKAKKNAKRVQHGNRIHDVFEKLWITQLHVLLSCKRQSLQVLPKIAHNVSSPNLTSVIKGYIEITRKQITRLEEIFKTRNISARGKKSIATEELLDESQHVIEITITGPVRDAGVIASVQKIIHYQTSAYNTLANWSHILGEDRSANMLGLALAEETEADRLLTHAAHITINYDAAIDENKKIITSHYNLKL